MHGGRAGRWAAAGAGSSVVKSQWKRHKPTGWRRCSWFRAATQTPRGPAWGGGLGVVYGESAMRVRESLGAVVWILPHSLLDVVFYL